MSGRRSRNKGKTGERELAKRLQQLLKVDAHRSQQYCGAAGDSDISGVPGIHVECKRQERAQIYPWMEQATGDCIAGDVPVICHRQNGKQWLLICELVDLVSLSRCVVELVGMDDEPLKRVPK